MHSQPNQKPRFARKPLRVGFILSSNFTLSAFSNFIDVLRLAADENDDSRQVRCNWHIMSPDRGLIRSSGGLAVQPTSGLLPIEELDYVVVIGGLLQRGPQIDERIANYLLNAAERDVTLVGVCTGSFILQRLGLLDGYKCCISWYHYRDFLEEFEEATPVADQSYVIDRRRITCSGGSNAAHLAAFLVDRHVGSSVAQKALRILQIERMRPAGTAQSAPLQPEIEDRRIAQALLMMEQNLSAPLSVSQIAAQVGTSTRQLERVFKDALHSSPQAAYIQLRLRHAQWMLKRGFPLSAIAAETGFSDSSHLSKTYKTAYGVNPSQDRHDHAVAPAYTAQETARRVFDPA